jgi:glutathione S-transferase
MQLYYTPGACSLASHIALNEAGLAFDLVKVDLRNGRKTDNGVDFLTINPKGYIPALVLDNGEILSEGIAILHYVADLAPASGLVPAQLGMARYRLLEWLTFISTEVHKGFAPLWNPATPPEMRQAAIDRLMGRLTFIEGALEGKDYLSGSTFTIADAYLFTVVSWTNYHKLDISSFPRLSAFMARVSARPAVQKALKSEGLA